MYVFLNIYLEIKHKLHFTLNLARHGLRMKLIRGVQPLISNRRALRLVIKMT